MKNYYGKSKNSDNINQGQEELKDHRVGTFMGMVDITKEIFKNRKVKRKKTKLKKEDIKAAIITAIIVIILGIILWFVPATKGFIRNLIPF